MAYVLEAISKEDQEKILRDAACDPEKLKRLTIGFRDLDSALDTWVVDRERDCYMLDRPYPVYTGSTEDFRRYFFFREYMYEISQLTFFGHDVVILDMPPESLLDDFKQEVTAAHMVGDSNSAFTPIFKLVGGKLA